MSSFLWVEDFEGGQYREFASILFGATLHLSDDQFPDDEYELREMLELNNIYLVSNYAEAKRFIKNKIDKIDNIILDIDLNLFGEEIADDEPLVVPELTRWYGYDAQASNTEALFEIARSSMKKVAGYHLFLDLILSGRFPKDNILFCSNHADYMNSIRESFEPARIEKPLILSKSNKNDQENVRLWIKCKREEPYTRLRRWIIIACEYLAVRMASGEITINKPHINGTLLDDPIVETLLETLPFTLPAYENDKDKRMMYYRIFARTLTQIWEERLGPKVISAGIDYFWVLKIVRNWTSHEIHAFANLEEGDVAFLFLIAMRSIFSFTGISMRGESITDYERELLQLVGKAEYIEGEILRRRCQSLKARLGSKYLKEWSSTEEEERKLSYFSAQLNYLQRLGLMDVADYPKFIYQIFWQSIWKSLYAERNIVINTANPFLQELMRRSCSRLI